MSKTICILCIRTFTTKAETPRLPATLFPCTIFMQKTDRTATPV